MKPIALDNDAKELLKRYRFPGNIRQLKNLAEQISVLEVDRDVTREKLLKYLPTADSNRMPVLYEGKNSQKDDFSERDILYKVLFDMKKDVNDLKKLVHNVIQNEAQGSEILKDNEDLFQSLNDLATTKEEPESVIEPYVIEPKQVTKDAYELAKIEDITHETEDESLSLEKKEKEMIIKALRKNNNKRKHAANDLGISERTLYRKIKQYEIEE